MRAILSVLLLLLSGADTSNEPLPDYGSNDAIGKYIDADDVRLYCEIYGQGEPLLLIHGNGASIHSFANQIPELSKHFKVIAVDSRAQGRSTDSDKEITYARMASDMVKLLDALNIETAHVVGWSDGGIVGLELAYAHPDKVKMLVAINANFTPGSRSLYEIPTSVENPVLDTLNARELRTLEFITGGKDASGRRALTPQPERASIVQKKLSDLIQDYPRFSVEQLNRIETPTLVMAGDHDFILDEHTLKLFQALPHAQLCIIPGSTHFVPLERPTLVNAHIVEFLKTPYKDTDRFYWLAALLNRDNQN